MEKEVDEISFSLNDEQKLYKNPWFSCFAGSKPDKRRAAASAGSGKDKESAEAKELLKRVDERYSEILYAMNMIFQPSFQIITALISFATSI